MAFKRKMLDGVAKLIADLKRSMLPSGTVCWFYLTEVPYGWKLCDGTNGTPNLIGRYAVGSISNIGQLVNAGLPNIKGTFPATEGYDEALLTGPFYTHTYDNSSNNDNTQGNRDHTIGFDASRYNEIYGNSETVTPPSTKLLPCMKI